MSQPRYLWRTLTPRQREELLAWRKKCGQPSHSPPHRPSFGDQHFHVTAACYEHRPYIGHSLERMDAFARDLRAVFTKHASQTFAWCVLPNHYHALVEASDILRLLRELGLLMGAPPTPGTKTRICAGERCSTAPSSARCVPTVTTSPR